MIILHHQTSNKFLHLIKVSNCAMVSLKHCMGSQYPAVLNERRSNVRWSTREVGEREREREREREGARGKIQEKYRTWSKKSHVEEKR